jgi:Chaperone of endosialidase
MKNNRTRITLLLISILFLYQKNIAQIGINATNTPPATNAMLDISSTTKGLLIPRMTSVQRVALTTADGLTVYDTDTKSYWFVKGTVWTEMVGGTGGGSSPWNISGTNISNSNTGNVGIGESNPGFPLNFNNSLGDKISLYGNLGAHYGFGVQNGLLQIHGNDGFSDIVFGHGSSANFFERMRIVNGGGDGMFLKGRLNIRNGTSPIDINYGPGVWLHKADDTGQLAFMGTMNNQNVGFYGGAGLWGFVYDAINSRVGIGTTTPDTKLHVAGNIKMVDSNQGPGKVMTSDGNGVGSWQALPVSTNFWTANGINISNNNLGNIGIGTTTPGFPLNFGNTSGDKISLWGNTGAHYGLGIQGGLLQIYTDGPTSDVVFGSGNSASLAETMRIKGNGNVQVKSSAQESMWINGPTGNYITIAENTINRGYIGSYAGADQDIELGTHTQNTTGSVHLSTGNVPRLTVSPAGNVGINNTNPTVPLTVGSGFGTRLSLYQGAVGHVGFGVYGGELRAQVDIPGGKVSLGALDAAGAYIENALAQKNGSFSFSVIGSLWVNGTTYASDRRFKKNIKPTTNSLAKLTQLQGVSYDMNVDAFKKNNFKTTNDIGLIAQDVQKIFPEVVSEKDGYLGIDYGKLVPVLIESIKEQQKQIDELRALVKRLNK